MTNNYMVKKKKLFEEVIDLFEKLIKSEDYKIGDKLPSLTDLAKIFGVGKPTLREALSVLTSTGVLEVKQGSGVYIKRLSLQPEESSLPFLKNINKLDLNNWLEFRRGIEVESAAIAAERHTEDDLIKLESIHHQLVKDLDKGKIASVLDYEFHLQIAKSTKNTIFVEAITTNSHLMQQELFEKIRQSINVESRKELIISEHSVIITAIKGKKPNDARKAMMKHMINAERKMRIIGGDTLINEI